MLRVQQGQVGDTIALDVVDQAGAPLPLGDATELVLLARPPRGATKVWPGIVVPDPEASLVGHVTAAGDLAEFGPWVLQPRVTKPSGVFRGTLVPMDVLPALTSPVAAPPSNLTAHDGNNLVAHSGDNLVTH